MKYTEYFERRKTPKRRVEEGWRGVVFPIAFFVAVTLLSTYGGFLVGKQVQYDEDLLTIERLETTVDKVKIAYHGKERFYAKINGKLYMADKVENLERSDKRTLVW